ncbi:DUF4258 domain-containing protein [Terrimonas sp. NA20]|uniref:DUF4258 domain-containing protein n=1 Tax=Terrimonas ginsenosidimutans TaxID=2908004 RepID=A0ABS9KZN6_9BACT|nr:DUF4258 domain-containing protein [Terrimonas ginsenosidimutans]
MNKKWIPLAIVVVLGVALFFVRRSQEKGETTTVKKNEPAKVDPAPGKRDGRKTTDPAGEVDRNRGFDRRVSYIEFTEHAKCRMECRKITQREVEEIMRDGKINYKKSNAQGRPCPTYALEGVTSDDQRVRIVFAQCDLKTKVVTCIDLDTDWECHCPGDDDKYKNKR